MTGLGPPISMVFSPVHAAPLKLLALFLTLSAVPLSGLAWLGYRVLEQDRALEAQQLRERLDNAGSVIMRELDRRFATWEELLPVAARGQDIALPAGVVFLLIGPDGATRLQGAQLLYYPRIAHAEGSTRAVFAEAETREFRDADLTAAIAGYRDLTSSDDESVRAEALMRLARALRKGQRTDDALAVYARLARLGAVPVAGAPAELVAHRESAVLLAATGRKDLADRELALLGSALTDARYRIDRPTFEYFREALPKAPPVPPMTAAVDALWTVWQEQPAGRIAWSGGSDAFVSVWRSTPNGTAAI